MKVKKRAFTAVRWTASSAVIKAGLSVLQTVVLARLLLPEDFGVMAIVVLVLNFATIFADMGLSSAFVQRAEVTLSERSSLFWLNILMGGSMMLILMMISPLLSEFFGDERFVALLRVSATIFIINALGQQIRVSAEKALNFRPVIKVEVFASVLGFTTACLTAANGWGVYAIVSGSVVTAATSTILAWLFLANGWRPMMSFDLNEVKPYLGFGAAMVSANLVRVLNTGLDVMIGGRALESAQLGLYSVPRGLMLQLQFVINPIVTRVGFPLIAKVQDDVEKVRSIYLQTLNMTVSVNAPLYIAAAFFAQDIVLLLLGEQWVDSAEILRILAIWALIRSTGNPVGSLVTGMGRADLALKWNLSVLLLMAPFVYLGTRQGTAGLAVAMLVIQLILLIPRWKWVVVKVCETSFLQYFVTTLKPMLLALAAIYPGYLIASSFDHSVLRLVVGAVVATPLYLILSYMLNVTWVRSLLSLMSINERS